MHRTIVAEAEEHFLKGLDKEIEVFEKAKEAKIDHHTGDE